MSSPFPGMDPYLEDKEIWPSFHHLLADELMTQLNTVLSPKYYADIEVRTILQEVGISTTHLVYPDTAVLEVAPQTPTQDAAVAIPAAPIRRTAMIPRRTKLRAVRVYVTETKKLVTSIEILSPVNKRGHGLKKYRQRRERILRSDVHLIELDLLRSGQRPGWEVNEPPIDTDYIILLNRAHDIRTSEIWPIALNEPLPTLPVPLLPPDPDAPLDLGTATKNVYARAAYARRIDYKQPVPEPPLRPAMKTWLAEITSN
jgi:hypothetical protein